VPRITRSRLSLPRGWLLGLCLAPLGVAGAAFAGDRIDALLERIDKQDEEIQALRQEVSELRARGVETAVLKDGAYRRDEGEPPPSEYESPRIVLNVAGQINQAFNAAGDGHSTKGYFVDNDVSNTRMRFAGVSTWKEGAQVGSTLEVAFSPNPSSDVSQDREIAGDFFQVRRAELWARDDRYGRALFGQGSAAADNVAEYDLSLVSGPIMYSGVADIVGGLEFRHGKTLTGVHVHDAFFNFDSNRQNRIRYDSPMAGPVQVSVSAGSNQRYDAAITFGGDYDRWSGVVLGPFTALGAVGIYQPNQHGVDYRVAGSWSLLHNASGVSLTFSGGAGPGEGDTPYNLYGKLAWDGDLLPSGRTGFGVDYTWSENVSGEGDRGQSVGISGVQVLQRYGIELYSLLRWYSVDRHEEPSFHDIVVGTLGARVRF